MSNFEILSTLLVKRVEVILRNSPYHKNSYGLGKKKPLKTLRPYFFKRYFPVKSLKRKILQNTTVKTPENATKSVNHLSTPFYHTNLVKVPE